MAIDLSHLNHSVFNDAGLRAEVLVLFADQAAKILAQFDPAMDDEAWRHLAHTLKGSSRGIGAFALGDALADAEALCGAIPDKVRLRAAALTHISAECLAAIAEARALAAAA